MTKQFLTALTLILSLLSSQSAYAQTPKLRMVVTAAFVSNKGLSVYEELAEYLSQKLNGDVKIVSGVNYEESNKLLKRGIIQVGFICGLPYTQNSKDFELIAIPVVSPTPVKGFADTRDVPRLPGKYYSYTIVRKDSHISSWAQLKGKSFVYNEQTSNSGYNMPRYKLVQLGAKSWEDYFSRVVTSGSHEESIRMVAEGYVDASSVDSMVLDYDRSIGDANAANVRVIETLFPGGAGVPPVVVNKKFDPALRVKLTAILTSMHKDPVGKAILNKALLARFDPPNDANYDDIRHMEQAAHQAGFRDHVR